jgi:HAD superfamily hydrolase (TIGR01509 family)
MSDCRAPAKRRVRAVILDAGGVLILPNLDWIAERAAEDGLALTRDELYWAYYRTALDIDLVGDQTAGAALIDLEIRIWFFSRLLAHGGVAADRAATVGRTIAEQALARFPRESDIYHWAMPWVRERLLGLRRAGFVLGVASNNDGALIAQLTHTGVVDLFGALMDSGIEGVAKPDPELLLRAARSLGVAPEESLFVGDVDRVDGAAARAAGMAFALIDPLLQQRPSRPLCIGDLDQVLTHFTPPER